MENKDVTDEERFRTSRDQYNDWLLNHQDELKTGWRNAYETVSGLPVQTVYTPLDLDNRWWSFNTDVGFPGEVPFTRGFVPNGYRKELWKSEMYAGFGSAEDANKRYRYLIEQGSTGGVSLALDLPTQLGLDPDDPLAIDEVGQIGVSLSSLADIEKVFDGIPLNKVERIFSTANCIGPIFAAWILVLAEKQGVDISTFRVQIQNDPIKEYIARGTQFLPIEPAVRLATDTIQYITQVAPTWLPISISGSHMRQAGASPVQEAAFTICNGISYIEQCLRKGMKIDDFGNQIEFHFCTEMEFFEEIAKYRAVRKVWSRLVRERFGGTSLKAQHFRLHAATSGRPLTAQQPLNNIARIALQALAQVLGGVEQTRTASFDEALGIPTEQAATVSIRINQIIGYETGIPYTVDPLGGSYFIESLTKDFESIIYDYIKKTDEMGGAIEAAKRGYFQDHLTQGAYRNQVAIETGEQIIVGVNKFQNDSEPELPIFEVDESSRQRAIDHVKQVRSKRDNKAVKTALDKLEQVCRTDQNVFPAVMDCARVYATIGEITSVWRKVFGEFKPSAQRM